MESSSTTKAAAESSSTVNSITIGRPPDRSRVQPQINLPHLPNQMESLPPTSTSEKSTKVKKKPKPVLSKKPVRQAILTSYKEVVEASQKHRELMGTSKEALACSKWVNLEKQKDIEREKDDNLLAEFDQYVVYTDMEKQKQRALELQSTHTAKGREQPTVNNVCGNSYAMINGESTNDKGNGDANISLQLPSDIDNLDDEKSTEVQAVVHPVGTRMGTEQSLMKTLVLEEEQGYIPQEHTESDDGDDTTGNEIEIYGSDGEDNMDDDDESTKEFLPTAEELTEERKPEVGMLFDTLEAAHRFMNVYGYLHGFAVLKGRNYRGKKITLQCTKCRKTHKPKEGERKRRRSVIVRTNCPMNVIVQLQHGQWKLIGVSLDHNHDLLDSPSLTKFFSNQRHMSEEDKNLSTILQDCRVPPRRIMSIFRRLKGSRKVLSFNKKKIQNLRREEKREKNTDIAHALKFVEKLQSKNQGIAMKMQTDPDNTVRSILWTDARSRMDYELYGDFLSFDTTFSTNKYNMPFAPFIGINGQGRTIVFAWALLKDQSADTFKWALETFLDIMNGKRPKIIMTDQCRSIKSAIDDVLKDAWHRFCFWHIMNNCSDNMGGYMAAREGMEEEMKHIILDSLTVDEFENAWAAMIVKYDAGSSKHLPKMWECRKQWVPVYFKNIFCPFIRTTGRSEGMNSIFKDYVKRKDTLETFFIQYDLFQETVIEKENEDRFVSNVQQPIYWGHNRIERHASKLYTRGIFFKFQTELQNSTAFAVEVVEAEKVYNLRKTFNYAKQEYHRETFQVKVDMNNKKFDCICGKFQRDGILCCHVLRLFTQFDLIEIPEHYITKRWTKDYREAELMKYKERIIVEGTGSDGSQISTRYAVVLSKVTEVCAEVCKNADSSKEFLEEMQKLKEKYTARHKVQAPQGEQQGMEPLKDPPIRKAKSVEKGDRLKRPSEKNANKRKGKKKIVKTNESIFNDANSV